nr:helix-turn-helix domain-containing protein [uncultured Chryseobacterium sp.]
MRIIILAIFLGFGYSQAAAKNLAYVMYLGNFAEKLPEQPAYEISDVSKLNDELKKINNENKVLKQSNKQERLFSFDLTIAFMIIFFSFLVLTFIYQHQQEHYKNLYYQKITFSSTGIIDQNQEGIDQHNEKIHRLHGINPIIIENILSYLETFENQKKFLKKETSLLTMSKECGTNTTYLSKIINHYKNNNFASYLNELRLNYAVELWKNKPKLRYQSIQEMADMVGFNTAQSFSKKFHEKYNISPTHFLKNLISNTQKTI